MLGLIIYCILIYFVGGIAASITYHRMLTHGSVVFVSWFEKVLVLLSLPAGTPIQWVGTHRQHHNHTDRIGDPHSPHIHGFWYAHCGWYIGQKNPVICFLYAMAGPIRMLIDGILRPRTNQEYNHLAKDIAENPFYKKVSNPWIYLGLVYIYVAVIVGLAYFYWNWTGIFGVWIALITVYNIGDGVNSFGHLFGEKLNKRSQARNNVFLQYLGFGEGAHAYHHKYPRHVKLKTQKRNFDIGFSILLFLKKIGLVKYLYIVDK